LQVQEPVARPLDVIAAEVVLTLGQALLVGVLLWLGAGFWEARGVEFGPVLAVLVLLAVGVGGAWLWWLLGGPGWPLAAVNLPVALLMGFVLLLGFQGTDTGRVGLAPIVLSLASAIYGVVCGVFLPGPRRVPWQGNRPARAVPGRPAPATPRLSPTTTRVIEQYRPKGPLPRPRLPSRAPAQPTSSGLTVAPDVPPLPIEVEPDSAVTSRGPAVPAPTTRQAVPAATPDEEWEEETRPWPRPTRRL
jgi:hypothetical protein